MARGWNDSYFGATFCEKMLLGALNGLKPNHAWIKREVKKLTAVPAVCKFDGVSHMSESMINHLASKAN